MADRTDERLVAKASHIGRFASRERLERRLGPFEREGDGSRRVDDPRRALQQIFAAALERWVSGHFDGEYTRTWDSFRAAALAGLQRLSKHGARTIWA